MRCYPKYKKVLALRTSFFAVISVVLASLFWSGCHSAPPPAPAPVASSPAPAPVLAPMDDIPASASPAVRAHLIKLREMRDLGQITDGEYQSRKAALINWKTGL